MKLSTRNSQNHAAGVMAEQSVARYLTNVGHKILHMRWPAKAGELDIVSRLNGQVIITEVKKSKTHSRAAHALSHRQQHRIMAGVAEYLATMDLPMSTDLRIDVATVDKTGQIEILENALMQ